MKKSVLILVGSCSLVLLTSVYCKRDYTCSGVVLEAGTSTALDSVWVGYPGGGVLTNAEGEYLVQFATDKGPRIEFSKEGYTKAVVDKCRVDDRIELEQ